MSQGSAVLPHPEVADDAVLLRAKRLDGSLRSKVETVVAEADHLASERLERMIELARGVDLGSLIPLRMPGETNFHLIDSGHDVMLAGSIR